VNLSAIDINLVVALDALLRERNVTRAARRVGLSQPAMSHALTRLRGLMGDPLLVRVGRQMQLTARAEAMAGQVAAIMHDLAGLFGEPPPPFDPATSSRAFRIAASEFVDLALLSRLNATLSDGAPRISVHLVPALDRAAEALRSEEIDLALGVFPEGALPADVRRATLFHDRFVGLARMSHPRARGRVAPEIFASLAHIAVPGRGAGDGVADDLLAKRGVKRRVAMTVPHVLLVPPVVAGTDLVATVAARIARAFSSQLPLREFELPVDLPPVEIAMLWSNRTHNEPGRAWLRELVSDAVTHVLDVGRRKQQQ
jgi:DNA-binding transcriptional LysR family regulator